uniref:Uncharacterized protein n=1 Tax=Oryza sativa subsp. japonica TaxID=39947 RepID=Q94H29_ORYSJ|nr:hypothetical protein [Oryza sativa Japonica Group]
MAAAGGHRGAGASSRRPRRCSRLWAHRVATAWGLAVSPPCPRVRLTCGAPGAGCISATIRTGLRASVAKHYRTSTCLVGYTSCGPVVEMSWHMAGVLLLGAQPWLPVSGILAVARVGSGHTQHGKERTRKFIILNTRADYMRQVGNQLGMHSDGPKLHATTSVSQAGQVPVRTGGMRLMTYSGGTTNLPDQVEYLHVQTGEIQYNLTEHIAQTQE